MERDTLLLDGDCGLCNRLAQWLRPRMKDPQALQFFAIESDEGKELIATFPEHYQAADSVYLLKSGRPYIRSAAAIRCLPYLKWYYAMWYPLCWLVPLPLRNLVYRFVAKVRHRIFKAPTECYLPIR
ncbi:MAG: DUF393 domain-containing protein [Candidatus Poseidonia sp.]|nr:DUF393 domain-containing protein [Poseidonia sp.]